MVKSPDIRLEIGLLLRAVPEISLPVSNIVPGKSKTGFKGYNTSFPPTNGTF